MIKNSIAADDAYAEALRRIDICRKEKWTILDLRGMGIRKLPQEISQLTALRRLDLENNQLRTLPQEISHLTALTTLYLRGNQLRTLPKEIGQLTALAELDLRSNQLKTLPPHIGQLKALKTLYLHDNVLNSLPPEIGQLKALTTIGLHRNIFTTLPPEIGQLSSLTTLGLCRNQLTTIPPEIGRLKTLKTLGLDRNRLTILPPEIGQLTALMTLNLNRNQLSALPPEIGQLRALRECYLEYNRLTALPGEIGQLTALTELRLYYNLLTTLPPEIGQLRALTYLHLSENRLKTLPAQFGQLKAIRTLLLVENELATIPAEIGQLKRLTLLNLESNQLTTLPREIGQQTALMEFFLKGNQLTSLPPQIGQLQSLTTLDLDSNQLTSLPPEIGQLKSLTTLDLESNQLTSLPPEIGQMISLTTLDLDGNQLTTLPEEIGQLTALTDLRLARNQLTNLPPQIGQLTALTALNIAGNQLTMLPPEIGKLTALTALFLHDNLALGLPESILGRPETKAAARPGDILNFYFTQRSAAAGGTLQPLNEIKVMLVGDGGAGKTSLRRFFKGRRHSKKEKETHGIALDTFLLRCGSTNITVRLWDFAGQEITHALHQFFLTEGCVYLVVVEPRSDNEQSDAENWLKLIARYGNGAPALVVLNKQDTRLPGGYDLDRNLLRERFPFIRDFHPTTCDNVRKGCDELRESLRTLVTSMPEATLPVPRSWIHVKDECFEKGRDGAHRQYLSLKEFRTLCAKHGERDRAKQESLARILHQLGAVLHFVDEPRLRDTAVLNPHWVTDGAYRLLRCKDGPKSHGILTLQEAIKAVPNSNEAAARYLLGLMERFEMCFPVEDADGRAKPSEKWLVPGSLDRNQPDQIRGVDWQAADRVRLRYTYDPLPQGVIPRFIVMTHPMSEGQPRWRNGVVLVDGAAFALVRKAQNDNTVEVTVQGPEPDRENLVRVVRGYLARIHRDLPEPKPKEYQELSGIPDEFREVRQMKADERHSVPIVVETEEGDVERNATVELNRSSDEAPRTTNKRPLRVFLSYSHDDLAKQKRFRKNLMALENDGYFTFWDDPNIQPDMDWRPEIDRELEAMDVFIGLLTTNFVTSKFIQRVEFKRAMERRKEKSAKMWLVLVDNRRIEGSKFEGIQVLKPEGKAVSQHKSLQAGFDAAEKELHQLVVAHWNTLPEEDHLSWRIREALRAGV